MAFVFAMLDRAIQTELEAMSPTDRENVILGRLHMEICQYLRASCPAEWRAMVSQRRVVTSIEEYADMISLAAKNYAAAGFHPADAAEQAKSQYLPEPEYSLQ